MFVPSLFPGTHGLLPHMAGGSVAGLAEPVHTADTTEHTGHNVLELPGLPDAVVCVSLERLRAVGIGIRSQLR